MPSPSVGARLSHANSIGTIRWTGEVDGAKGSWLGIEWDDPTRGKHDGTRNGRRYFSCRLPNSGSFLKAEASYDLGRSFLEALVSKYVEGLHEGSKETVILGSSKGAIEVEAVRMDKIRTSLARLDRLRSVTLDLENVAFTDPEGRIRVTCPNVTTLDMSSSLLPSWTDVMRIVTELPNLETLILNRNRFEPLTITIDQQITNVKHLHLNSTMTQWNEISRLISIFPHLEVLQLGSNHLETTGLGHLGLLASSSRLQQLFLDSNRLQDWQTICNALRNLSSLTHLILTSNNIKTIPARDHESSDVLQIVKNISLGSNAIQSWSSVDALQSWCPSLENLAISGNPCEEDAQVQGYVRPLLIAKLSSLAVLNASRITPSERRDSELWYLSHIARTAPELDEEKSLQHPRWTELCEIHGRPADERITPKSTRLARQLLTISVQEAKVSESEHYLDPAGVDWANAIFTIRVLPTMKMNALRLKILKLMKLNNSQSIVRIWLLLNERELVEMVDDEKELAWWGIENDDKFAFTIANSTWS